MPKTTMAADVRDNRSGADVRSLSTVMFDAWIGRSENACPSGWSRRAGTGGKLGRGREGRRGVRC